ncbi:MAG: NosD domain-containing protein [Thermofilaceae archaeon]
MKNSRIVNAKYGVWLTSSIGSMISWNTLEGNEWGIGLHSSQFNTLEGNVVTGGYIGIYLVDSSNSNIVRGNNASGNEFGIAVLSSSNNTVYGNFVAGNSYGIFLEESRCNVVEGNTVEDNFDGLVLSNSSQNIVVSNRVSANREFEVWLYNSSGNIIRMNVFTNNLYGLYLKQGSNSNLIEANSFSNCNLYVKQSYRNTVAGNTVNGKPLIYLEGVSHATVKGVAGQVVLVQCDSVKVEGVNVSRTTVGILLSETNHTEIVDSSVSESYIGVGILSSHGTTVNRVNLMGNREGISLDDQSSNNLINGSRVVANWHGILLSVCSNNTVSWSIITNNTHGVTLVSSSHIVVSSNTIANNSFGVSLQNSSSNLVRGNRITRNEYGIDLGFSSCGNIIERNLVRENGFGVRLNNSSGNSISENLISRNNIGIRVERSIGNIIARNGFLRNLVQADNYDSTSEWDLGYPEGGNYWSDYRGEDFYSGPSQDQVGSDGIGDNPYSIDEWNKDRYPIMLLKHAVSWYSDEPPFCAVKLLKGDGERAEVAGGELLEVYLGDSSDDTGIRRIRFTSYTVIDGTVREERGSWYYWEASYGNWDPYRKVATFTFTETGTVELRVEVEDDSGQVSQCRVTIIVQPPTPAWYNALLRFLPLLITSVAVFAAIIVLKRRRR